MAWHQNRHLSPLTNSLIFVFLLIFVSIIAGCNTAPTGSSPSQSPSPTSGPPLNGKVSLFTLPMAGSSSPAIIAGPDGNAWFTEVSATINGPSSKIGRITLSGKISEFPPNALHGNLGSITVGPDGNLWFTDGGFSQGGKIGSITPTGGIKEFPLPASPADPTSITTGADGNLWFTDGLPSQIAKIERITATGAIKVFPLPPSDSPGSITAGPDGNVWFTETIIGPKTINSPGPSGQIGRITPAGKISTYRLLSGGVPSHITMGPDHNLWFSEEVAANKSLPVNKIGRITPAGTITEFALPPGNSQGSMGLLSGIAASADGYLWFTDAAGNAIGRITTTGTISEFALPTPQSLPENIAYASGDTLWFTEPGVNGQAGKIGKLTIVT
jgi:streptogramin lyase